MKQLTVLFLVKDSKVLLAMKKRGFGAGRWNGVGGKVEPNETLDQAAVRECQEEIEVRPIQYQKMAEIVFHEQHEGKLDDLQVHVFICEKWEGEPIETEEMAPKWFDKTNLPLAEMWADDPYWLPQVLEGKMLKCEFWLDTEDKVSNHSVSEVQIK